MAKPKTGETDATRADALLAGPAMAPDIVPDPAQASAATAAGEKKKEPTPVDVLADQVKVLRELSVQGAAREEKLTTLVQDNMAALRAVGSQAVASAVEPAAPPGIDLTKLADPVSDPEKFRTELGTVVQGAITAGIARVQTAATDQSDNQTRLNDLWSKFGKDFPDEAVHSDLVETVARQRVKEGQLAGLTPSQVIFQNPEGFMRSVAEGVRDIKAALIGDAGEGKGGESGDGDGKGNGAGGGPSPVIEDDKNKPADALGIPGGTTAVTAPKGDGKADDKPGRFDEEINAEQKKGGFM